VSAQATGSVADVMARAKAVQAFADDPLAEPLIAANKRIANLLKQHDGTLPDAVQPEQFEDPAEQALFQALMDSEAALKQTLTDHHPNYGQALTTLAGLRQPVDAFFEGVMVMAEDPAVRANRLAVLARLRAVFLRIADVARLGR
jgi:glycyl-tRNA synthetase beta chain